MVALSVVQNEAVTEEPFVVTDSAASAIRRYLGAHEAPQDAALRVGIRGGGCSGLSYFLEVEGAPRASDHRLQCGDVVVLVDPKSMVFLKGSTLDYVTGLMESGFKFVNPKAGKGCGCGESFSPA
jgi:iron-sulfur cluster assembly protein